MARTPKPGSSGSDLPSIQSGSSESVPSSASDPQMIASYTLPQWLVPERYKDKQSSQNTMQTRVFSIPMPQVPIHTKEAIRAHLIKTNPPQKAGMRDSERKLKELKQEEKIASSEAKLAKDKLAQALLARSEKLKEIRKAHELETTKAMEALETTIRKEWKSEDLKLKKQINEECKLEYERKFDEEMIHKRKREQEEDEKEQAEVDLEIKKAKEEKEEALKTQRNPAGEGNVPSTGGNNVQVLEKKQADLKDKVEKLSEKKSEMIWLFKQVIKQEAIQKMKAKKLKKAAEAK